MIKLFTCFVILIFCGISTGSCQDTQCEARSHIDYNALKAFYESTNGSNWTNNAGWKQVIEDGIDCIDPCEGWYGVQCRDNRVFAIDLDGNEDLNIVGNGNNVNGNIPAVINQLKELKHLNLRKNGISGSLPPELFELTNLLRLGFENDNLSGRIPDEIGNLSNLLFFDLRNSGVSGPIPESIGDLSRILNFIINDCPGINGTIPSTIGKWTTIRRLDITGTSVEGEIPSVISELTTLANLYLQDNNLSGPIPEDLSNLTNITAPIWLYNNNLSGCFPSDFLEFCDNPTSRPNVRNNPLLPWEGDYSHYCNGEEQIGAVCDDGFVFTDNDTINEDCTCGEANNEEACFLSYSIGPIDPGFRARRCFFQPDYDEQVRDSEAILIKNVLSKRKYVFDFCDGYSIEKFEAQVTIVDYDGGSDVLGDILYQDKGCNHEFQLSDEREYEDILIIINDAQNCDILSKGINNGMPTLRCGIGRN